MMSQVGLIAGPGSRTNVPFADRPEELVEIGLFLTRAQAGALIELSRDRRESVGQILRGMIKRELMASDHPVA